MPDADVLRAMYGPEYASPEDGHYDVDSPRDTAAVLSFLKGLPPGRVLDFGCGQGDLLEAIQMETDWTPIGVELEPSTAAYARARTGAEVLTYQELVERRLPSVQVLHLGDVIEHLTDLDRQLSFLLGLIDGGGYLLAEGPLQCGPTLFEAAIQIAQVFRTSVPVELPPHHVIQASARGQRVLFGRHGLTEASFLVYEVDWPAPSRLRREDLSNRRTVSLYALRRLSRQLSRVLSWGNRYRYVGSTRV